MTNEPGLGVEPLINTTDTKKSTLLEETLRNRKNPLRFPDDLEADFQKSYTYKLAYHIRLAMWFGLIMFLLSSLYDFVENPYESMSVLIRVGVFTPVILFLISLGYSRLYLQFQQLILFSVAMTLAAGLLMVVHYLPNHLAATYINGALLLMIFMVCFARMQFWYACMFTTLNLIGINFLPYLTQNFSFYLMLSNNLIFLTGAILLLMNNFVMEYAERQQYLQDCMISFERENLMFANQNLQRMANMDGLTGIANFRYFDSLFHAEWNRSIRYKYPIAILMIDFDNFKNYNDTYGHQAGDEILKKIAVLIEKRARRPGDISGRYGGDEFIIMLIDANEESAAKIAEALRQEVQEKAYPHKSSPTSDVVSLTIGVAAMVPDNDNSPEALLKAADDSLLFAKQKGRNCVASSEHGLITEIEKAKPLETA